VPATDVADRVPFTYVILRAVPSVERGERINVGVVVFCRQRRFLGVRWAVDPARLAALGRRIDGISADAAGAEIDGHLRSLARVAQGDVGAGPVAALEQSDRFGWLAAPSSTIVQPSAVHTGLCDDPIATLDALFGRLVEPPAVLP
jgi:Protein of unknown function (DUF3037)